MEIYDKFCNRINEVKGFGWKDSWTNSVGMEEFEDYSRNLSNPLFLHDLKATKKMIGDYTGFVKLNNEFVLDFGVYHPCDFLYFEKGKMLYSQGVVMGGEVPVNKTVFYNNNYSVERNYDLGLGLLLSRISRRAIFNEGEYSMTVLQSMPNLVDFYISKKNSGLINFKMNENSKIFESFRNGADGDWRFHHFYDLVNGLSSSFFSGGKKRLDLPFNESISLLQKL